MLHITTSTIVTSFTVLSTSMTLKDPERPKYGVFIDYIYKKIASNSFNVVSADVKRQKSKSISPN